MMADNEVLTMAEVAQLLRITTRTVHRLLDRGELKARKVGREWRFLREDVFTYLRDGHAGQPQEGQVASD